MKKSKIYTKTHTSKKAIINHTAKIKKRGGMVTGVKAKKGTKLIYSFGGKSDQLTIF